MRFRYITLIGALWVSVASADASDELATFNYQLHCQGCHLPDGAATMGRVPALADSVGHFLHSEAGRRFLLQVPGVATSTLPDDQLADLLNWMISTFSADEAPPNYQRFTAKEVRQLRRRPEMNVVEQRDFVMQELEQTRPGIAEALQKDY